MLDIGNFTLRQIQYDDDTTKLSLGNAAHTPLKIFLKKSAFDFHQYEIAKTYVLIDQNSSSARVWGYITLMNSEIILNEGQRPQETSATSYIDEHPLMFFDLYRKTEFIVGDPALLDHIDWFQEWKP